MIPTPVLSTNLVAQIGLKNMFQEKGNHEEKYAKYTRQKSYLIETDWELNA